MVMPREADLICLSPSRWDPVFQRSSHLMSRAATDRRVFFVEEPEFHHGSAELEVTQTDQFVVRVVPKLPHGCSTLDLSGHLRRMMDALLLTSDIRRYELWYGSAAALPWTKHLMPQLVVCDATDASLPRELLDRADLVFTSRHSVYQKLRAQLRDVHAFPSSADVKHFGRARQRVPDPEDQAGLPHPRLGCWGGVDARLDFGLLDRIAELQPDWHIVLLGPVAAWEAVELPRRPNIHWLHEKSYSELPQYLAGWDVGILPYKVGPRTAQLVNPAKAAELLAAGKPVVSTPLPDVVNPYGELHLVRTAADAEGFVMAVKASLLEDPVSRLHRTDAFLAAMSWDTTWQRMTTAMSEARARRLARAAA